MRLIVVLLSYTAFVAGALPPVFPMNCQLTGETESHEIKIFGVAGCAVTGSQCQSNTECKNVDTSSCQGKGRSFQAFVICHKGFCKLTSQKKGDYCNCTMGCTNYNSDGDFECVNNICTYKACAKCGESNAKYTCCPPGINDNGVCYCAKGGCEIDNDCLDSNAPVCCKKGVNKGCRKWKGNWYNTCNT